MFTHVVMGLEGDNYVIGEGSYNNIFTITIRLWLIIITYKPEGILSDQSSLEHLIYLDRSNTIMVSIIQSVIHTVFM